MSQFLRILLLIVVFVFLFRILKRFLAGLLGISNQKGNTGNSDSRKKKYENIEEARYTDISDKEDNEKMP